MRILLYGMQSSGASVLAFTLAQRPDSLAFVDIWNTFAAPELKDTASDIIAKAVVTTAYSLQTHRKRFRPDLTLLVLRYPTDNYYSLSGKVYANENGLIDEKFSLLEEVFKSGTGFDQTVHYEDFAFCPGNVIDAFEAMGWKIGYDALLFDRTQRQIQQANGDAYPDIDERLKYGPGNIQTKGLLRNRVQFSQPWGKTGHLPALCPGLFEHYAAMRLERGEAWQVASRAVMSCGLHPILRELNGPGRIPGDSVRLGYRMRFAGDMPGCRITDTEVVLSPAARRRETRLSVYGLPSRPFNRFRGTVFAEHPLALGTATRISIKSEDGTCLAEKHFLLRHSMMQNFDLEFAAGDVTFGLVLGARQGKGVASAAHAAVCFRDLRLEQAAG